MAQKTRQTKLFAAEDYTVVYESYINANFQAFDYDTMRSAMVDYVRNTYPENYNDWVESAEFVSLLDVVAQFGHNLAYRVDLNARNNFLTTSKKQESVYKLAEFLGYQPRRNVPAYGEMKVIAVKTNEAVIGSAGTSLGGNEIKYEITNNSSNLDDFITVLNAALQNSNRYGSPAKSSVIDNIKTDFYNLNNTSNQIKFDIEGTALGKSATFNVINSEYDSVNRTFTEKMPDPVSSFGVYFKNDGKGINSINSGFFAGVKQGSLAYQDFVISDPIDNAVLDVTATDINQNDVWVQNINETGNVSKQWTKVSDVNGNVIYNNLANGVRDVYSVKTRANNQISIVFPDRAFGNIPKDTIRVWYRTSANSTYVVRPDDLTNKKVQINYTGLDGNVYTLALTLQLKQPIANASSNETLDSIRENAPRNYATQDRMITASDYNTMLSGSNGGLVKIKSVNRTFSGHSRYSKFTDPTGMYSDLYLRGSDAVVSESEKLVSYSTSSSDSSTQIFEKYVKNIINNDEFVNLYYTRFKTTFENLATLAGYTTDKFTWISPSTTASGAKNGYIIDPKDAGLIQRVGETSDNYMKYITPGAMIKFKVVRAADKLKKGKQYTILTTGTTNWLAIGASSSTPGTTFTANWEQADNPGTGTGEAYYELWSKVVSVSMNGLGIENIGAQAGAPTGKRKDGTGAIVLDSIIPGQSTIEVIYPALSRRFISRERDIIKTYLDAKRSFSVKYNYKNKSWDVVSENIGNINDAYPNTFALGSDSWILYFNYTGSSFDIYLRTVRFNFTSSSVRLGNIQNEYDLSSYTKKAKRDQIKMFDAVGSTIVETGKFFVYGYDQASTNNYRLVLIDGNADSRPDNPLAFTGVVGTGNTTKSNLNFEWQHVTTDNQVVDPSFTNVIDVFALTSAYDTSYKNWLNGTVSKQPSPPTSYALSQQFGSIEGKKAMSDTIVYKPVKYKPIFGIHADPELKARFRIIKLYGSNITDSDLKSKTVTAINEFFSSSEWDFGETFYFTELAAYVHKELAGVLSSFVIVPQGTGTTFGDLFEYTPNTDEMLIADVTVNEIDIIQNITDENIRAGS